MSKAATSDRKGDTGGNFSTAAKRHWGAGKQGVVVFAGPFLLRMRTLPPFHAMPSRSTGNMSPTAQHTIKSLPPPDRIAKGVRAADVGVAEGPMPARP